MNIKLKIIIVGSDLNKFERDVNEFITDKNIIDMSFNNYTVHDITKYVAYIVYSV